MFQVKKWNWKRVATNLLLVPVLTGGSAVALAQFGKSGGAGLGGTGGASTMSAAKPAAKPGGTAAPAADAKQFLKDGRRALDEGRFEDARDLAQKAESHNASNKWGLFDDTPNALRKDIDAAKAKAQKTQAEQLMKQAIALAHKPAANDGERAYNLDGALQMARKADQLHGPYSAWELGNRADKLVKELEAARARLKVTATAPPNAAPPTPPNATARANPKTVPPKAGPNATAGANTKPPGATGVPTKPFANTLPPSNAGAGANTGVPPAGGADVKKIAATRMMNEAKALAEKGQFGAAKAKYVEADRVGATYAPGEYNPGFALQELNARGAAAMDRLVRDAQAYTAQKDFVKADSALTAAGGIATTLGLFPKPITEGKAALWVASGGKFGANSPSGTVAVGGADRLVPAGPPVGGAPPATAPSGPATVYGKPPVPTGGSVTGRQLLDQAAYEFSRGEFDTAAELARKAHNLGVQEEARGLLNSIDAEKLAQKKRLAAKSLDNARTAYQGRDFKHAMGVLVLIDPNLLPADAKGAREQMLIACKAELDKAGTAGNLVSAGGNQPPGGTETPGGTNPLPPPTDMNPGATNPPGVARVAPDPGPTAGADAIRKVQFQKLRSEGLKVQADAQAAFGRGETDLAMQLLLDYSNRVRASGLDPSSVAMLLRPVDGRLDTFRMMKGQADVIARQNKEKRDAKELIAGRGAAEEQRKTEVGALVRKYHDLVKRSDFAGAERVALQAKQLDPDDPAVGALAEMAKLQKRVKEAAEIKDQREKFFLHQMNDADRIGPVVTVDDPVAVKLEAMRRAHLRGSLDNVYMKNRTPAEFDIELRLEKPITIEFRQTPLDQAIKNLQTVTGLPLVLDYRAMQLEQISEVQPLTFEPGSSMSAKNVLSCILEQAGLSYVIEHDAVKITTTKKAKGRLFTKVFSVADLVTPVPNFALPDHANFDKMLSNNPLKSGALMMQGVNVGGGATPHAPAGGLGGGQPASFPGALATTPGVHGAPTFGPGGTLQASPLAGSANVAAPTNTKHEQLIKLITSMVRPFSWDGHGGAGKVEFFDIGSALVVNQTADVIVEVEQLLEALRRLQDLSIAIEVRIVSLAEAFFERMGVDFSMNIKTNTAKFEPALTTNTFRPQPFINDINNTGVTIGLTPAGTFTPDLDVPIRATSFQRGIPGFGNYPNSPGNNGGIALGLAFLNDIQVYTFMEMAQGDQRSNIMQAPKLTLFNGQTATLTVANTEFFVTSVQVLSVNGQIVFIPNNTPLPGPGDFNTGGTLTISVQGVVSADRRFVRLNLPVTMAAQSGASVPLFPVTTFVTPVFEGGSQGQPIPFTQFLQQPSFTTLDIQTTVVCPDGGTVLLGGLKTVRESRNEFGPPFLSKVPYLNRLFKNVGVGRDTRHIMIMVTPRIIINAEEEIIQTEGGLPGTNLR